MRKKFNDIGLCISKKHYMADTSAKISAIMRMVEDGAYFTINRPRQYGKTTIAHLLGKELVKDGNYSLIEVSFEGIGDLIFDDETTFCIGFFRQLGKELAYSENRELLNFIQNIDDTPQSFDQLSVFISELSKHSSSEIVLIIDEIDKSTNNQVFLSFLGMLRDKYLKRDKGRDTSFQSVILAGVHDIKSLKLKLSPDTSGKLNSPWNIAVDFKVEMSFNPREIQHMLNEYCEDRGVDMDSKLIAERIYYYTSGYPYLVSKICKVVDEELLEESKHEYWNLSFIDDAFKYIVDEAYSTTLFDDMVKNLENNFELYQLVFDLSFNGKRIPFNVLNPTVNLAHLYGIVKNNHGQCQIHNRIFEQKIYGYILSKQQQKENVHAGLLTSKFYQDDQLNFRQILLSFQAFMRENYSHKDIKFLEREGRLLFLSFLKPIINGKGFDFKEPSVAEERRMDIVITYNGRRYIVELKRWEGEAYHQRGLSQLSDYLDTYSLKEGYLLILDFRKSKEFRDEDIQFKDKKVYAVWV